jgi:hypothetical protein
VKSFKLTVGLKHRQLRIEPGEEKGTFKLYAAGQTANCIDKVQSPSVDLPPESLVGIIRVRDETDFDFEGSGDFTGQDLLSLAAQIVSLRSSNSQPE